MYFDQILDLELDVSFTIETMADTLATRHWEANVDGRVVEFVLGGVLGDDRAFIEPIYERSEAVDRLCLQHEEWSHQSTTSSIINFKG